MAGDLRSTTYSVLPMVTAGPFAAENVPVAQKEGFADDGDGVLGMGFLSRFDFAIDQKARRLYLIK